MTAWTECRVTVNADESDIISQYLLRLGTGGVVTRPGDGQPFSINQTQDDDTDWSLLGKGAPSDRIQLISYFDETEEPPQALQTKISNQLKQWEKEQLISSGFEVETATVYSEDWENEWKKYYHPLQLTADYSIIPVWEQDTTSFDHSKDILLDPGLAFGTGQHETTKLSAEVLVDVVKPGQIVYDVGTGSGILSILAAKLGAAAVIGLDNDEQAIHAARANAELNGLDKNVSFKKNDLLAGVSQPADVIVANILEPIIMQLIPTIPSLLKKDGRFIISGILTENINRIEKKLANYQLKVESTRSLGTWGALVVKHEAREESTQ